MTALIVLAVTAAILAAAVAGAWLTILAGDAAVSLVMRAARRRRDVTTARRFDAALLDAGLLFVDPARGIGGPR